MTAEYEAAFSRRIAPEACIFFWPSSKLRAPQLPTPKGIYAARAVTRGPRIDLAGPDASDVRSPLRLQLKFRGFDGATINLDSLRVTYVKMPNVDLTSRVRPYAQQASRFPDAEAPPGEHLVRVEIHDSEGRRTVTTFLLSVAR